MSPRIKEYIYICAAALVCVFGLLSRVRAQAVPVSIAGVAGVSGTSVTSAAGADSCTLTPGSTPSDNDGSDPVKLLIWPDGNNYGIRGAYNAIPPDCSSLPATQQELCESLSASFVTAVNSANEESGFPQGTVVRAGSGYGNNSVSLQLGNGVCPLRDGDRVPLCESSLSISNGDTYAFIYFDLDSLNNPSTTLELSGSDFQGFPLFAACDLAHELTHTFGLADTYNDSGPEVAGLMGDECVEILQSLESNAEFSFADFWDPNAAATVAQLNSLQPITIASGTSSCTYSCPGDSVPTFSQAAPGGAFSETCTQTDQDYSCNCGDATPYCNDLSTQETITPPPDGYCSDNSGVADFISCDCEGGQATNCTYDDGTPAPTPDNYCSDVPAGETCDCLNGVLINGTCTDTDGTAVPPPSGFSCAPAPTSSGGYSCSSDGSCVYNPSGGQYADPSCDDACSD